MNDKKTVTNSYRTMTIDNSNRLKIKFSHEYEKLEVLRHFDEVNLLQVIRSNFEDLSKNFKDYDTDNGTYQLPERGKCLILIFKGMGGIFTTIRSDINQKYEYYKKNENQPFSVVINNKNDE